MVIPMPDKSPVIKPTGIRKGLTNYGDTGFALFLRKAFIKGAGYSDDALDRTIIGIANTGSGYNPATGTRLSSLKRSSVVS
jgi:dihydroxy-acid dehydratase